MTASARKPSGPASRSLRWAHTRVRRGQETLQRGRCRSSKPRVKASSPLKRFPWGLGAAGIPGVQEILGGLQPVAWGEKTGRLGSTEGGGGALGDLNSGPLAPLRAYPLSLPFCRMERQTHLLCCPSQPWLTPFFPVLGLGLGWVAGPFWLALCPPSLSLALPSPCQSVNLPGASAAPESPGRPWEEQ